jgi:AcrR family transcriptional regulator
MIDKNRQNTKERILAVATDLFAERHYDGTSMRDVASAAEVTLPAIYYYFTSKEGLYQYIMQQSRLIFVQEIKQAISSKDSVRKKLIAMEHARQRLLEANRSMMILLMREQLDLGEWTEMVGHISPPLGVCFEVMKDIVNAGIENGELASEDANLAAWYLVGVFNFFDLQVLNRRDKPRAEEIEKIVDLALHGVEI